jgi:hypothetical protein
MDTIYAALIAAASFRAAAEGSDARVMTLITATPAAP